MNVRNCPSPIAFEELADYWAGEASEEPAGELEQHLMGCGECAARLESLVALIDGIATLVRRGELRTVLSAEFLEQLKGSGLRAREYALPPGGGVQCTITPQDDLLIARLYADLTGAQRLDLVLCDGEGREGGRMVDVPFSAAAKEVIFNEPAEAARQMGTSVFKVRMVEPGSSGDRLVAEYTFNHSRYDPGDPISR